MHKKIGLIELPGLKLIDPAGRNWTAFRARDSLISKQILMAQLTAGGYDVELVNLKDGGEEYEYGSRTVRWRGMELRKLIVGRSYRDLDAASKDVWGVTSNYVQEREPACLIVEHLARGGATVVVGGSDAFVEPQPYLAAGATAVVQDKSGAANLPLIDFLTGAEPREALSGVVFSNGKRYESRRPPLSPQDWPIPSEGIAAQTLGGDYWETPLPDHLRPVGSVMTDIGCDRRCDFCETPLYKLGYRRMNPERALQWFEVQKRAGARSVICPSDQFLGRILFESGRDEILEIVNGVRSMGIPILWGNGLELKKTTLGRGRGSGDPSPDVELVDAVYGWDGEVGCYQAYLPAERPTFGYEAYSKLLPWKEHREMLRAIVRSGIPDITYGLVVGLPDDSHESMKGLEEAVRDLYEELHGINPELIFNVNPFAIRPLPGTPQARELRAAGLLRFEDPAIIGGFWTACADTKHLSYEEVSDWQSRLSAIGSSQLMDLQGITGPQATPQLSSASFDA